MGRASNDKSPFLHLFPGITVEPKKPVLAFIAKVKGMVFKKVLGEPVSKPHSLLPFQLCTFSKITCGIKFTLFRLVDTGGRGALLPNNSLSLNIDVLRNELHNHVLVDFTQYRV